MKKASYGLITAVVFFTLLGAHTPSPVFNGSSANIPGSVLHQDESSNAAWSDLAYHQGNEALTWTDPGSDVATSTRYVRGQPAFSSASVNVSGGTLELRGGDKVGSGVNGSTCMRASAAPGSGGNSVCVNSNESGGANSITLVSNGATVIYANGVPVLQFSTSGFGLGTCGTLVSGLTGGTVALSAANMQCPVVRLSGTLSSSLTVQVIDGGDWQFEVGELTLSGNQVRWENLGGTQFTNFVTPDNTHQIVHVLTIAGNVYLTL